MDIEKLETPGETPLLRFYDLTKTELTLWASEDVKQGKSTKVLYFDIDTDYVKFLQEDIKTILPYLQAFAETGQLEPQESTLQGENELEKLTNELLKAHRLLIGKKGFLRDSDIEAYDDAHIHFVREAKKLLGE